MDSTAVFGTACKSSNLFRGIPYGDSMIEAVVIFSTIAIIVGVAMVYIVQFLQHEE